MTRVLIPAKELSARRRRPLLGGALCRRGAMTRNALLSLLAALAVTGCANVPVIGQQDPANSGDTTEIRTALSGAVTPVTVLHNPFPGVSDAQLAATVASAMPAALFSNARFTGNPAEASGRPYRIVWDFGANNSYGGDGGCSTPLAPVATNAAPGGGGVTDVRGTIALCRSGGVFTRAYGYVNEVTGPDAPNFRSFVRLMANEILIYPMPEGGPGGGQSRP